MRIPIFNKVSKDQTKNEKKHSTKHLHIGEPTALLGSLGLGWIIFADPIFGTFFVASGFFIDAMENNLPSIKAQEKITKLNPNEPVSDKNSKENSAPKTTDTKKLQP